MFALEEALEGLGEGSESGDAHVRDLAGRVRGIMEREGKGKGEVKGEEVLEHEVEKGGSGDRLEEVEKGTDTDEH